MKRTSSQISEDTLQIQPLSIKGKIPIRSSTDAAGYDISSAENKVVPAKSRLLIETDIAIKVPIGTYGKIASRSGLAIKNSIDIGAGTIDADYRGPVKVLVINNSNTEFCIKEGDRIAQLILVQIKTPETKLVESLDVTSRGKKGFGSTGISETPTPNKPEHGERLFFEGKLQVQGRYIKARLLLDCGATSPILREEFVRGQQILTKQRSKPISIWNASQQPIAGAGRYYTQPIGLEIGNHSEVLVWEVGAIEESIDVYLPVAWLQKHNPDVNWQTGQVKWRSKYCIDNCLPKQVNVQIVDAVQLLKEVQECDDAFIATLEWRTEDGLDILDILPTQYHKWAPIFSREQTSKLPAHTKFDHRIKLVEGAEAPWGPLYGMTEQELKGLREWLD